MSIEGDVVIVVVDVVVVGVVGVVVVAVDVARPLFTFQSHK